MTVARRVDAREFRSMLSTFTDALDGDGGAAAAEARHERRRLHVSDLARRDGRDRRAPRCRIAARSSVLRSSAPSIRRPVGDGRSTAQRPSRRAGSRLRSVGSGTRFRPGSRPSAERHVCRRYRGARAALPGRSWYGKCGPKPRVAGRSLGRDPAPDLVRCRHRPSHHGWTPRNRSTSAARPARWSPCAVACPRRPRRRLRCSRAAIARPGWCDAHHKPPLGRRRHDCARQSRAPLPATPSRRRTKARRPSRTWSRSGAAS